MTADVAIIGVGLHPFVRFEAVTGIDVGAVAIRRALADAGVEWRDIQFAFGGSYEVDNPDAVVALMALRGSRSPTSTTSVVCRLGQLGRRAHALDDDGSERLQLLVVARPLKAPFKDDGELPLGQDDVVVDVVDLAA